MAGIHGDNTLLSNYYTNYYKTFSGTDTLIFIIFQGCPPVCLGSISTISYSVYRTKQPVINLGRTNINGVTRGARIFAGSIVFTLINQHWVRELQDMDNTRWLGNFAELKSDELPPFDLMVVSANEYGSFVAMYLFGVETTDEGQVVSINDMFTETTCSFIARDIEPFTAGDIGAGNNLHTSNSSTPEDPGNKPIVRAKIYDVEYKDNDNDKVKVRAPIYDVSEDEKIPDDGHVRAEIYDVENETEPIVNTEKDSYQQAVKKAQEQSQKMLGYTRPLSNNDFRPVVGNDVKKVQLNLKELELLEYATGIYDKDTQDAVKKFQSENGLVPDGVVDARTWIAINDKIKDKELTNDTALGSVINVSGARVYKNPCAGISDIVYVIPYDSIVSIIDKVTGDDGKEYYSLKNGFVEVHDVYSYYYDKNTYSLPTLKFMDTGYQVLILQNLVTKIYPSFTYEPGVYNETLRDIVAQIQKENGIPCIEGVMNEETWKVIETLSGINVTDVTSNKVSVLFSAAQGEYNVSQATIMNLSFQEKFDLTITPEFPAVITVTNIGYYNDGGKEILANEYTAKAMMVLHIPFSDSLNIFNYSIDHSSTPYKVERIVYASNGNAYKWIFYNRGTS